MPRYHDIWDAKQGKQVRVPFTPEEETARDAEEAAFIAEKPTRVLASLRQKRNEKLRDSDWTQFLDTPIDVATQAKWATYRQELRDLPATTVDPAKPLWPVEPK